MEPLKLIVGEGGEVIPLPEPRTEPEQIPPRIFVASIGDYEQYDRLHGNWLDATGEPEALEAELRAVVRGSRSGSPLWGVYEAEGFYGLELDAEWQDLGYVSRLANGIAIHGEAFKYWAQLVTETEQLPDFEERYIGRFKTAADYAQHLAEEFGVNEALAQLTPGLRPFVRFDTEAYAKELVESGCVAVVEGSDGVHCFAM